MVIGFVVKGDEWYPAPQLREAARARARTVLDRSMARLGLVISGEPRETAKDDGWGGILLTLTAQGRLA